jgi:hypothetical protein
VEVKEEIIGKHEQGMQVAAIARFYKKAILWPRTWVNREQLFR